MVVSCSAYRCRSRFGLKDKNGVKLKFHRFPLDDEALLRKWTNAVKRESWTPTKFSFLCSKHFSKDSYRNTGKYLKTFAVPTLFDLSHHPQKHGNKKRKNTEPPVSVNKKIVTDITSPAIEEKETHSVVSSDKECMVDKKILTDITSPAIEEKETHSVVSSDQGCMNMIQCPNCPVTFTQRRSLNQHMRDVHDIMIDSMITMVRSKILCSLKCGEKFKTHEELRTHLVQAHKCVLEKEVKEFANYEMFEMWKKSAQCISRCKYVIKSSEKVLQRGQAKTTYFCNRGGFKSAKKGPLKRKPKKPSFKIDAACPALMEVTRYLSDNTFKVVFWKTHVGHDDPAPPAINLTTLNAKRKRKLEVNFDVCVVVPAAGVGERMGLSVPKQYIPINEKPVICHTVDAFLKLPYVKKVIVVAAPDCLSLMAQALTDHCTLEGDKLIIAVGENTRHQSIKAGIKSLATYCDFTPEIVVIHDGVRPFVPEEVITQVVVAASEYGAAGVVCPLVPTVVSADDKGFLDSSLDRNRYKSSEMPQAFKHDLINHAYDLASEDDMMDETDCLHLVHSHTGVKAQLLNTDAQLWKIVHQKDIHTASAVLKEMQEVCVTCSNNTLPLLPRLKTSLEKKFSSAHSFLRLDPINLGKFENFIEIHEKKTLGQVLDKMNFPKTNGIATMVHVLLNCLEQSVNFLELQKQTKIIAKAFKETNVLIYFVVREEMETMDTLEELADLITSIVFESNPYMVGNIFLS